MATINSLSSSSSSSAYGVTSKGIGGLATGLDTDEIIKGMTIGIRSKIAKQLQSKQLLTWQTDAYRSISTKLIDFSKKYTSFTSSTNLLSTGFYTKTDISTSGSNASKVSVSGSSEMIDSISISSATRASSGGAVSSANASSQTLSGSKVDLSNIENLLADKNITFSLNSTAKSISFSKTELTGIDSHDKLAKLFQNKMDQAFGKGSVNVSASAEGALEFKTANSGSVLKISDINSDAQAFLGLKQGGSNRLDLKELSMPDAPSLSIGGADLDLKGVSSVQGLMDKINGSGKNVTVSYIESLDRFEFKTDGNSDISISGNVADKFFGGSLTVKAPTKAQLTVQYGDGNNITLESSNNTFNIDGLTVNVNETFAAGDPVRLSAKTDTDKVFNAIKDMVKDYNDIVELVNTEYSTKRDRNFPPLTDEQKEEMSESEIKSWEEKAKKGMLFGNTDMASLSRDLRTSFFSSGDSMEKLKNIGVTSSSNWQDNGKIIIDEEKLRKAIEEDPLNIKEQFADGVMTRLKTITDKYAKTEGATKGILIEKAGNTASPLSITKNTLLTQMKAIDKVIESLNTRFSAEQSRYYRQFSNLETVMSRLNSQSGWLAQQFG